MGNLRKISIARKHNATVKDDSKWLESANDALDYQYNKFTKARKTIMRNTIKKLKLSKEEEQEIEARKE